MRKYTPPSEVLVGNPSFLATMNFVESALYPVADPSVARPVGTVSDINYRTVYETVFFGNQRIPGLFSQKVAPASEPKDVTVEDLAESVTRYIIENQVSRSEMTQAGTDAVVKASQKIATSIEKAKLLGAVGLTKAIEGAPAALVLTARVELAKFGIPLDSIGNFFQRVGSGIKEGVQPASSTTSSGAVTPSFQLDDMDGSSRNPISQSRIVNLSNNLVPVIRYQDFRNIPYGRDPSEFVEVPSDKLQKAETDFNRMQAEYDALPESAEKFQLGIEIEELGLEVTRLRGSGERLYRPIPGRGPLIPLPAPSPLVVDYSRRRNVDPQRFTPELQRIFAANDALMQEPAPFGSGSGPLGQINETQLTEEQISSEMRELRKQNKLSDAYQRIASVRPGMNLDKISDINGIDSYGYQEFASFVFDAQRMGMTYQQYLAQLENDPEQLARVAQARGGGARGGVTIRLPSDDDLTQVFKYVSQATIGRTLPKESYQEMIAAYKPQLVQYQQQLQGGGTVTEPPQAETFAETRIEQQFGQEAFTYQLGGYLDELSKLAGGGQ